MLCYLKLKLIADIDNGYVAFFQVRGVICINSNLLWTCQRYVTDYALLLFSLFSKHCFAFCVKQRT